MGASVAHYVRVHVFPLGKVTAHITAQDAGARQWQWIERYPYQVPRGRRIFHITLSDPRRIPQIPLMNLHIQEFYC